jgi:hypothetical protein
LENDFSVVGSLDIDTRKFSLGSLLPSDEIQVETSMFSNDKTASAGGFTRFNLDASGGNLFVDGPVITSPKGFISLKTAGTVNINANIFSPGGTVFISGGDTSLANNVKISTSGIYTNDTAGISGTTLGAIVTDAGTITIEENDLLYSIDNPAMPIVLFPIHCMNLSIYVKESLKLICLYTIDFNDNILNN